MLIHHDPLVYLPRARVQDFPKYSIIYDANRPPDHLYLVISGRVKIYYTADDGTQTLLRIVSSEEFFGETSLIGGDRNDEYAAAVEASQVMAWTPEEIENQVEREPALGIALVEYCATYNLLLQERLAGMATLKTGTRVALSLIQLANSLGKPAPSGRLLIQGMTHQAIADYAGTSREIVTSEMNRLRRLGHLVYSRGRLEIGVDALRELVRHDEANASGDPLAQIAGGKA